MLTVLQWRMDALMFSGATLAALLVVHGWLRRRHRSKGTPRMVIGVVMVLMAAGWFFAEQAGGREQNRLRRMIGGMAPTYALELQRAGHARLSLQTAPEDALFLTLIHKEIEWLQANPSINDVYTLRRRPDGKVVFLVDSETDYDHNGRFEGEREARTAIGEEFDSVTPALEKAFAGQASFDDEIVTDRWGTWVGAFAPIRDAQGAVEGVVGVDYDARDWVRGILWSRGVALGCVAVLLAVVLVSTLAVAHFRAELLQRRHDQQRLEESEARFRRLADTAPVLIWMSDAHGRGIYFNQRWAEFTGRGLEQQPGGGWEDDIHPDDRDRFVETSRTAREKQQPFMAEFRLRRADGEYRWMLVSGAARCLEDGSFAGHVGTCADITEPKMAEAAMLEARNHAESASQAKTEFLAAMSHEIRTPMNGVLGFVDLLLDTPLNAEQKDYAETIRSSGAVLLAIINDILDFSKIEAGKFSVERIPLDMESIAQEVVDLLRVKAVEKGVTLAVEWTGRGGAAVAMGDPARVRQILFNLVGNAVKFTLQGSVRVILEARPSGTEGPVFRCAVVDTGIGIPNGKHEVLFEKFSQADTSSARRFGGTGLGLAISKKLVELMSGSIGMESVHGRGSTFWFTLPLVEGASLTETQTQPAGRSVSRLPGATLPSATSAIAGPALRVLVAEDNLTNQRLSVRLLNKLGCQVDLAANGREAVDMATRNAYAIIFMDCHMPEMDGLTATAEVRRGEAPGQHVPIVALTASVLEEDRLRCLAAGMDDGLWKPISTDQLSSVLQRWTRQSGIAADGYRA